MQFCVSPVSYTRLHRVNDASAPRLSRTVIWQIIVPKLFNFVGFRDERVNFLYDGTKKKNENSRMPKTSISELHHISYTKQFLPGIAGTKSTYMQGLKCMNDQPLKTVAKQLHGLRGYRCPSWSYCHTLLARDGSGQLENLGHFARSWNIFEENS